MNAAMINQKYVHSSQMVRFTDAEVLVPFVMTLFSPKSVVDVGCGPGSFLYTFRKHGVQHVLGIEGEWVNKNNMLINEDELLIADLETSITVNRRFDVALCVEVAEHVSAAAAPRLVNLLVNLSDVIVFSAAIPNQGGQNHINEQWPNYWMELFGQYGYVFYDIFRPKFWNNEHMYWWYKQNMFLVARQGAHHSFSETPIHSYIHPELFLARTAEAEFNARELGKLRKKITLWKEKMDRFESFNQGESALADYVSLLFRALKNRMRIKTTK
jgi:SAM-dependent methyltransferase